ncbi:PDR/VanB family oxidoreductase [Terrihabitans sp. B22-R8]|uniref:PDR/VanB family oxidoreductase n=1 Tax=Terrihabitans sp. B22-R8 TaxID=3425128 RepID=UPI00403D1947
MSARVIMKLVVTERIAEAEDVMVLVLRHASRPALPAWRAGAHIDVHLPDGKVRQYSLCGDPADLSTWRIAVKREAGGRGGSGWLYDNLAAGDAIKASAPRSHFALDEGASRHIFIAGGIGVTPLVPMAREAAAKGGEFHVHYCARGADKAALLGDLRAICGDRLTTYFSGDRRFDADAVLAAEGNAPGTHVYACGPARLTDAVRAAGTALGWPEERLHFEVFKPVLDENFKPEPFDILIRSTGEVLRVPAERSALDVLKERGFSLLSSCELGVCGSCICGYSEGNVIHRDSVLGLHDRQSRMAPCVSRARGSVTLDL